MFAMCGMKVRVTDVSATAVAFQQSQAVREGAARLLATREATLSGAEVKALQAKGGWKAVSERFKELGQASVAEELMAKLMEGAEGEVAAERHDFLEPYATNAFEIIVNAKALQGFRTENQRLVARTHYQALKPKGTAIFQVQNVQDKLADDVENALEEAGFLVPGVEANRWRRRMLRETGIPYAIVLGRAVIPRTGDYREDAELRERDMARLAVFDAEYEERLKAEQERAVKRAAEDSEVRFVQMIWGTG